MIRQLLLIAGVLLAASCGSSSPRTTAPAKPDVGAPSFRLSDAVVPTSVELRLRVIPDTGELSGRETIRLEVKQPTTILWLHAVELEIGEATLGGKPARVVPVGEQTAFVVDAPLAVGASELVVSFKGKISERDYRGVFRQQVDGAWYVFTQFESIEARRAFPCFDEPGFKVPWRLTLEVPAGLVAASNSPIEKEGASGSLHEVTFAETPALPSYLVAFVVGPFDVVDGGVAGKNRTPLRYLVPRGRAAEASFAKATNGKILELHEDYYGIPYPFAKLDSVAVPGFGGAMENPGLITYSAILMLMRPGEEPIDRRRAWIGVAAHEQAHQWFGNLVTMSWWDDIWLNESFASWAGDKVTSRMMKSWDPRWLTTQSREAAMNADALASARKIRQPVTSNDGIGEAFDRITYDKGQTVLEMAEAWVGEEPFRQGVREYLTRNARKNTTGADFVRTIGEVTNHPELSGLLATFLEQGGLPSVRAQVACKAGEVPAVTLAQERFLQVPAEGATGRWSIPLCLRTPAGKTCTVLTEAQATVKLEGTRGCPKWLHLDAEQKGYYHAAYSPEQLGQLFASWGELSPAERSGVIDDTTMDVKRGRLAAGAVLEALAASRLVATGSDDVVLARVVELYKAIGVLARHAGLETQFEAMVVRELGPRARAMGWVGTARDPDDLRIARLAIVPFVAEAGEPALVAEATRLADRVLRGEPGVPADVAEEALAIAAGRKRTDIRPFLEAARRSHEGNFLFILYRALGEVRDPAALPLVRDFVLSSDFVWATRGQLDVALVGYHWPALNGSAIDFVERHYEVLAERIPKGGAFGDYSVDLVKVGGEACDAATRDRVARFFGPRNQVRDGGPRETATALEKIDACVRILGIQRESLETYLKR